MIFLLLLFLPASRFLWQERNPSYSSLPKKLLVKLIYFTLVVDFFSFSFFLSSASESSYNVSETRKKKHTEEEETLTCFFLNFCKELCKPSDLKYSYHHK
jgi:hypothetical protein